MMLGIKVILRAITTLSLGGALMLPALSATAQTYDVRSFLTHTFSAFSIRDTGTRADGILFSQKEVLMDDGVIEPIHIPFEFYFFGKRIHTVLPTSNLFLTTNPTFNCGSTCTNIRESSISGPHSGNLNHQGGIYPFWTDAIYNTAGESRIFYELLGDPGDQILSIEFSQINIDYRTRDSHALSAQVRLWENGGRIEFIYSLDQLGSLDQRNSKAFAGIAATADFLTESTTPRYYSVDSVNLSQRTTSFPDHSIFFSDSQKNLARERIDVFFPDFYLPRPPDLSVAVDADISYTLPKVIYSYGAVTYELMGLPTGFSFERDTRVILGRSNQMFDPITLTYEATDDIETVTQTFAITVTDDTRPNFATGIPPIHLIQNTEVIRRQLPTANSGNTPLTYTISPSLPAGLVFDPAYNYLYGVPTEAFQTSSYTFTATDIDGDEAMLTFTIAIDTTTITPLTPPTATQAFTYEPGETVKETLAPFTGGIGKLMYTLTDEQGLMDTVGLSYIADTRVIEGNIHANTAGDDSVNSTTYTYTATDEDGDTASKTFTITVVENSLTAPIDPQAFRLAPGDGVDISLFPFTGGIDAITYSSTDEQGVRDTFGLTFNASSLTITGSIPEDAVPIPKTVFIYTATSGDETITTPFTIEIPNVPDFRGFNLESDFILPNTNVYVHLPGAEGGDYPVTYSFSPIRALPPGLSYNYGNPDEMAQGITGTVRDTAEDDSNHEIFESDHPLIPSQLYYPYYSLKATDDDGDFDELRVHLRVIDPRPIMPFDQITGEPFAGKHFSFLPNETITPIPLPDFGYTESNHVQFTVPTLEYSVTGLPQGLMYSEDPMGSRMINGTPTAPARGQHTVTYTANDGTDVESIKFVIAIEDVPDFETTEIDDIVAIVNITEVDVTLPVAMGGDDSVAYSLIPTALPPGLTFNSITRRLSGTPTMQRSHTYTYTATNLHMESVDITFSIIVEEDLTPMYATDADKTFELLPGQNYTGEHIRFPDLSQAGNMPYTTIITRESPLRNWLELSENKQYLSGRVPSDTVRDNADSFTVSKTITDSNNQTATVTYTFNVIDAMPVAPTLVDHTLTQDTRVEIRIQEFTSTTSHDPFLRLSASGLPADLVFSNHPHRIYGTPREIGIYLVTITATDGDDIAIANFTITVVDSSHSVPVAPLIQHIAITPNQVVTEMILPEFTGGNGDISYTLSDVNGNLVTTLVGGLNYDQGARTISGTVTGTDGDDSVPTTYYTYEATDSNSGTPNRSSTLVSISATDEMPIVSALGTLPSIRLYQPIMSSNMGPSWEFPIASGGDGTLTYTIERMDNSVLGLPNGLSLDTTELELMGEAVGTNSNDNSNEMFNYVATDADGDRAVSTFQLQIIDYLPDFDDADIEDITIDPNTMLRPVILPIERSDPDERDGIFTYSISPSLPENIRFNPTSRLLYGTAPSVETPSTTYTYSVTDRDGDSDSIEFTITVEVETNNDLTAPTVRDLTFSQGQDIGSVTLPDFGNADSTTVYTLTPSPSGLSLDRNTRILTGSPDTLGATTVIYRATTPATTTGAADETAEVTFTFTIESADTGNDLTAPTVRDFTFTLGADIGSVTLPDFGNADSTTVYTLTPSPSGLSLDRNTRILTGIPDTIGETLVTYRATTPATTQGTADETAEVTFTITINEAVTEPVDTPLVAPNTVQGFSFVPGEAVEVTLAAFTGGDGDLTYALNASPALPTPLTFDSNTRVISGTLPADSAADESFATETYTYTARDQDGDELSTTFTLEIVDDIPTPVNTRLTLTFSVGETDTRRLPEFAYVDSSTIEYSIEPAESSATLPAERFTIDEEALTITAMAPTEDDVDEYTYIYTATDAGGDTGSVSVTINIVNVPLLEDATASAIPTVGANIALVASQAISSRVELALDGLNQGIDIRTLEGRQFRLNPNANNSQQHGGSSGSPVRFGVWYSAASDSLSDTRSTVTWEGTTDSTNLGFDVGFDISESASLVVGILQNSSSTSATYGFASGEGESSTLSVDLDSTAYYIGLGYDWLDAWFASGSADSTLNDSVTMMAIPASFSYQTIGLTASFEIIDSLSIGGKLESLTSDLSLTAMEDDDYSGLQTDSSQMRTTFVANYKLKVGLNGNGLLMPKFEFGFRDLSLSTDSTKDTVAIGGSAMETGFGVDYFQRAWGLTLGFDMRSISVENYSSESMQWQIRWESGSYSSGLSFGLKPHAVSETLGGVESLYSGGYNQYQSLLERQRGGNSKADTKGIDFEVGYGIVAGIGTLTPYLKTTNYRGSGNRGEELGIRYQTLQGLELSLKAERSLTPQTIQILGFPLTHMQDENSVSFNTRYSF